MSESITITVNRKTVTLAVVWFCIGGLVGALSGPVLPALGMGILAVFGLPLGVLLLIFIVALITDA